MKRWRGDENLVNSLLRCIEFSLAGPSLTILLHAKSVVQKIDFTRNPLLRCVSRGYADVSPFAVRDENWQKMK